MLIPLQISEIQEQSEVLKNSTIRLAKYQKKSKVKAHITYEEEWGLLLTKEEKKRILGKKLNMTVKSIMASFASTVNSTKKIAAFVCVRNYLMLNIFVRNGHRTGVVSNMTITEFEKAHIIDGRHVIKVLEHKTNREYGMANVVLKPFFEMLTFYKNNMRGWILSYKEKEDHVFFYCHYRQ